MEIGRLGKRGMLGRRGRLYGDREAGKDSKTTTEIGRLGRIARLRQR